MYGFDYPPGQGGDDDRPHTAFFRELEISNDWAQWWLGLGPRQGGAGTTTFNSGAVQPVGTDGFMYGMPGVTLDTSPGAAGTLEPTQDATTGAPDPRAKAPMRLRTISSQTAQRPFRQERVEADYAGQTTANGGAIISTRDSVSIGFGLEQIADAASVTSSCGAYWRYLLPTTADTTAPTVTWLRPSRERHRQRRRPGRDRGRGVGRARRHQGGAPQRRRPAGADEGVVPVPAALAAGGGRHRPTQEADGPREDKAGNVRTADPYITVTAGDGIGETPKPTGVTGSSARRPSARS